MTHGTRPSRTLFLLSGCALSLFACLGQQPIGSAELGDEGSEGDSADDVDETDAGSSEESTDTESTDTESTDTESTDTGEGCGIEFAEVAPGSGASLSIRNARDVDIYIPTTFNPLDDAQPDGACANEPFAVFDGDTQVFWHLEGDINTCDKAIQFSCTIACSEGGETLTKIAPGQSVPVPWGNYVWVPVQLTEACIQDPQSCELGHTCWAGRDWTGDGALTARLRVSETCPFGDCPCEGSSCTVAYDAQLLAQWPTSEVEVEFDGGARGEVEIVIE